MPLATTKAGASSFGLGFTTAVPEVLGGMVLMTPTSVDKTGTGSTATIGANGSVDFSSCETLSLNGVFNTDYDNYVVSIRGTGSGSLTCAARLRISGTDNSTTSSYTRQTLYVDDTSVGSARTSSEEWHVTNSYSAQRIGVNWFLYGPFLAQATAGRSVNVSDYSSAYFYDVAQTHNQSTSYDGFTLIASSPRNISGLISVYGLVGT